MFTMRHFIALAFTALAGPALGDEPGTASRVDSKFELRLAETEPAEGLTEATIEGTSVKVYLHESALLDESGIAKVSMKQDAGVDPALVLDFTPEAAKKIAEATEMHRGKPLAVIVDGNVLAAPIVMTVVSDRSAISGSPVLLKRIKELVERLQRDSPGASP